MQSSSLLQPRILLGCVGIGEGLLIILYGRSNYFLTPLWGITTLGIIACLIGLFVPSRELRAVLIAASPIYLILGLS